MQDYALNGVCPHLSHLDMSKYLIVAIVVFFAAFVCAEPGKDNPSSEKRNDNQVKRWVEKAKGGKWKEKHEAIKALKRMKGKISKEDKGVLMEVYDKETQFERNFTLGKMNEGHTLREASLMFEEQYGSKGYHRYYNDFSFFVKTLASKENVESLLKGMVFAGPSITSADVIKATGDEGPELLLELLESDDPYVRSGAFSVLSMWVRAPVYAEDYTISEEYIIEDKKILKELRKLFIDAIKEKKYAKNFSRASALHGLSAFDDDEVLHLLEKVLEETHKKHIKNAARYAIKTIHNKRQKKSGVQKDNDNE